MEKEIIIPNQMEDIQELDSHCTSLQEMVIDSKMTKILIEMNIEVEIIDRIIVMKIKTIIKMERV
jgi:hypothetical protein